jgi:hydroxyacylglutathione hydrolase
MASFLYTVLGEAETVALADELEAWLVGGHVDEVCEAGALEAEVVRHDGGLAVEARYLFASRESFAAYERDHAPRLRAEGLARFPSGLRFTRSTGRSSYRATVAGLRVETVSALRDNYAYLLHAYAPGARGKRPCVVIDPSEAAPVRAALAVHGLEPTAIWCTHHHPDHVGGVRELLREWPGVPVLGSAYDLDAHRIEGQTRGLSDGEELEVLGHVFHVVSIPGHTLGAIAFVGAGMAFTGDTLFLGGCGRVFEGTMAMMHASLMRLSALDGDTRLYVGHEYTEKNLEFAARVEPGSEAIRARLESVRARRARGEPTVPGTLREEHATNPFLRCHVDAVAAFARARGSAPDEVEVFAQVREAKNEL